MCVHSFARLLLLKLLLQWAPLEALAFVDSSSLLVCSALVHRHMPILCIIQPQISKLSTRNPKPKMITMNDDLVLVLPSLPKFSWMLASSSKASKINVGTVIIATNMSTYGFRTVFWKIITNKQNCSLNKHHDQHTDNGSWKIRCYVYSVVLQHRHSY